MSDNLSIKMAIGFHILMGTVPNLIIMTNLIMLGTIRLRIKTELKRSPLQIYRIISPQPSILWKKIKSKAKGRKRRQMNKFGKRDLVQSIRLETKLEN